VSRTRIEEGLEGLIRTAEASKALSGKVAGVAARYAEVLRGGGTLYFCGNGGSAADAQHLAAEYVVRYSLARRALAAVALTTDTSILTAAGNDLETTQVVISSLMDTWILTTAKMTERKRHRWLYVLKSRGMAHSDEAHEFRFTDRGIDILASPAGQEK